jgi:hypothetical protein
MRKAYPSDFTDRQWVIIEPLIPVNTLERPREIPMDRVVNAIPLPQSIRVPVRHAGPRPAAQKQRLRRLRPVARRRHLAADRDALRRAVCVAAGHKPSAGVEGIDHRRSKGASGATTGTRRPAWRSDTEKLREE